MPAPRKGWEEGFKVKAHTQNRQTVQPLAWEAWRVPRPEAAAEGPAGYQSPPGG